MKRMEADSDFERKIKGNWLIKVAKVIFIFAIVVGTELAIVLPIARYF